MKALAPFAVLALLASQDVQAQTEETSPHTEHLVQVNGVILHFLVLGCQGEALLFPTGYGSPAHVFDDLAPRFTDAFRVIALTRRGRAPSQTPSSGYDFQPFKADVKGVLDTLKFERVHIVAHSFGGSEATRLATLYPERIAS